MSELAAVVITTYRNHHRIKAMVDHVHKTAGMDCTVYVMLEPTDSESIHECQKWYMKPEYKYRTKCMTIEDGGKGPVRGINWAYSKCHEKYMANLGDDIMLSKNWLKNSFEMLIESGKEVMCLRNALHPRSTAHFLFSRAYADRFRYVYFPGYVHDYAEAEFAQVAKKNGSYLIHDQCFTFHQHNPTNRDLEQLEKDRLLYVLRARNQGFSTLGVDEFSHLKHKIVYV